MAVTGVAIEGAGGNYRLKLKSSFCDILLVGLESGNYLDEIRIGLAKVYKSGFKPVLVLDENTFFTL